MVFNAIKKPFSADNFLFFSYFLDINFLFFEAQNIYFVPNCTGQPVTYRIVGIYALLKPPFQKVHYKLREPNVLDNYGDDKRGRIYWWPKST